MRYEDMSAGERLEYAAQLMQRLTESQDHSRVLIDKVGDINCLVFALLYSVQHGLIGELNLEEAVKSYAAVLVLLGYETGREEERIDRSITKMLEPDRPAQEE